MRWQQVDAKIFGSKSGTRSQTETDIAKGIGGHG
jgi:hypothetical protein